MPVAKAKNKNVLYYNGKPVEELSRAEILNALYALWAMYEFEQSNHDMTRDFLNFYRKTARVVVPDETK